MIVKMKRLTLLCLATDRDAALAELRDLGVVHVTDVQPPAGEELDRLRARLAETARALDALSEVTASTDEVERPASELVTEVLAVLQRRRELEDSAEGLRRELDRYGEFGEFDLTVVRDLADAGLALALGVAPAGADLHRA